MTTKSNIAQETAPGLLTICAGFILIILNACSSTSTSSVMTFREEGSSRTWTLDSHTAKAELKDPSGMTLSFPLAGIPLSKLISTGMTFYPNPDTNLEGVFVIGPVENTGYAVYAVICQQEGRFALYLNDTGNADVFTKVCTLTLTSCQ